MKIIALSQTVIYADKDTKIVSGKIGNKRYIAGFISDEEASAIQKVVEKKPKK